VRVCACARLFVCVRACARACVLVCAWVCETDSVCEFTHHNIDTGFQKHVKEAPREEKQHKPTARECVGERVALCVFLARETTAQFSTLRQCELPMLFSSFLPPAA